MCCCVEGACEEVDWNWEVELVGEEEQEVVLTMGLYWASVGDTSWMIFSPFYNLYLTDADDEWTKRTYARVLGFVCVDL